MARRTMQMRRRQSGGRSRSARFQWGEGRKKKKRRRGQRGKNPLMLASLGGPLVGAGVQLGSRFLNGLLDKIGF